jgi:type 1 fimbria pilin
MPFARRAPVVHRTRYGPLAALGLLLCGPSLANAACTGGGHNPRFSAPVGVEFSGKEVAVGEALTPWLAANGGAPTAEFHCSSSEVISHRVESHGGFIGPRYHESGASYVVYPTGVDGVGYAFLVESSRGGQGRPTALGFDEVVLSDGDTPAGNVGTRIMVKYIRTGDLPSGSRTASENMIMQSRLYDSAGTQFTDENLWIGPNVLTIRESPSCRMRAQEVPMGIIPMSRFKGVGTHAGQRSYELVLDCEAGVGQVNYQAVPTTAVINSDLGLAEVSGGAQGVAYQFLQGDGAPMRFYATDEFGYGASSAEVLKKTFGVRYQQTLPTITPGPANGGLVFSLTFP